MRALRFCLLTAIVFSSAAVFAQKKGAPVVPPCPVTEAPALRGFRLGMTMFDARKLVADPALFDSKMSATNAVKTRAVRISGAELKGENGDGVDDMELTFADERLAMIRVTFNGAMRWDNSQDFFTRVAESLGLPKPASAEATRGTRRGNEKYSIECMGFNATLAYSFGVSPSVTIADSAAQRTVKERREKEGEGPVKVIDVTPRGREPVPPPPRR